MSIDPEQFKGHTPGPWSADASNDIVGPSGEDIGFFNESDGHDEPTLYPAATNAALAAAAPALLSEVRRLQELIELVGWRGDGPLSHEQYYCAYCGAHHVDYEKSVHKPDCVVSLARSALSSSPVTFRDQVAADEAKRADLAGLEAQELANSPEQQHGK